MALHQMTRFGSTPIGALLMGWVIQISSPRVPFALGGFAAFALRCSRDHPSTVTPHGRGDGLTFDCERERHVGRNSCGVVTVEGHR